MSHPTRFEAPEIIYIYVYFFIQLMLGKIEGRRRRGQQNEVVGWHHRISGQVFEQTPGDTEGQRDLAGYSPWGRKRVGHNLATEQ